MFKWYYTIYSIKKTVFCEKTVYIHELGSRAGGVFLQITQKAKVVYVWNAQFFWKLLQKGILCDTIKIGLFADLRADLI